MLRKTIFRAILVCLVLSVKAQVSLAPEEDRGRQIYEHGTSPSGGSIGATLPGDTRVDGSVFPCVNCHGNDGKGKPESGIFPSDITWDVLTKPYRLTNAGGRTRPAYSERLLKRAITMGIDSGGNALNEAMPRFQLSQADAADLIAYIRKRGGDSDPGLNVDSIRIGVILPAASRGDRASQTTRQALTGYIRDVNNSAGVFGRRIELIFMEAPGEPAQRASAVRDFLQKEQVFAVIGDLSGAEGEVAAVLRDRSTPAIAMVAPFPDANATQNPFVFYLDGGVEREEQALVQFAVKRLNRGCRWAIVFDPDDEASREAARWMREDVHAIGIHGNEIAQPELANRADVVFWIRARTRDNQNPGRFAKTTILIPGSLIEDGTEAPRFSGSKTYIARGTEMRQIDSREPYRWIWERATTSASILTEGLKASGRAVTRSEFLKSLEALQDVQTNLPVPITFGTNRHVGSNEVRIMKLDPLSGELSPLPDGANLP